MIRLPPSLERESATSVDFLPSFWPMAEVWAGKSNKAVLAEELLAIDAPSRRLPTADITSTYLERVVRRASGGDPAAVQPGRRPFDFPSEGLIATEDTFRRDHGLSLGI